MSAAARDRLEALGDLSRRLSRNHTRREIPWHAFDPEAHPASARERVGAAWTWRAKQEHLAVGAFSKVTHELAEVGCDPVVLGLMARASSDEVRHAALCAEWARRLTGDPAVIGDRLKGLPTIPTHEELDLETRVLCHVVEMCCFSETLTGVYFTCILERTDHLVARPLVEALLEDEIDHGRVGWAYLEQRRSDGTLDGLGAQIAGIADRTIGEVVRKSRETPEPSDPEAEQLGHLGLDESAKLYVDALDQVIVPGLEAAGVDPAPVLAQRERWPL